jgi:hypothetical protein
MGNVKKLLWALIKPMLVSLVGLFAIIIMLSQMERGYDESYSALYKNLDRVKNKLILMVK